jgi:hypothetical protein
MSMPVAVFDMIVIVAHNKFIRKILLMHVQVAMLETVTWDWHVLDASTAGAKPARPSLDVARSLKRRYVAVGLTRFFRQQMSLHA